MENYENNGFFPAGEPVQPVSGDKLINWEEETAKNASPDVQTQPQSVPAQAAEPQTVQLPQSQENPGQIPQPPVDRRKQSPFANSPYVSYYERYGQSPQYPNNPYMPQNSAGGGYFYAPVSGPGEQPRPAQPPVTPPVSTEPPRTNAPAAPKKKSGAWKVALASVLVVALVIVSCLSTAALVNARWEDRTEQMSQEYSNQFLQLQKQLQDTEKKIQQIGSGSNSPASTGNSVSGSPVATGDGLTPSQVYAQNVDSVVMVFSTVTYTAFGQTTTGTSTGSGFFISEDGYVLTNHHVIDGAKEVRISTHGGQEYEAKVIGSDEASDVALLKVEATGLPAVKIGSSDALIVGDQVAAIGNPLGELTATMTVGYISAKERAVTTEGITISMLQTDAAINSGNSGGPLFNMHGEVIGITSAKYSGESSTGASIEGIGFAIPIDDVMEVTEDILEFGYAKSAYMAVVVQDARAMDADATGVYVRSVEEGGPAAVGGIQAGDIITAIDGETVDSLSELTLTLREYDPGDVIRVTVLRDKKELTLSVTLTERPKDTPIIIEEELPSENEMPSEGSYDEWYDYFAPFFGTKPQD